MWCVTGAETTVEALRHRLREHASAPMHEIRLDALLDHEPAEVGRGAALVLTCRPQRQGGSFSGSEEERLELLGRWSRVLGPRWLDIELDSDPDWRGRAFATARELGARVLVSHHIAEAGTDPAPWLERLTSLGGDAIKLAVTVDDAVDLEPLWRATRVATMERVVLGMGPAGTLSRALYPRFGSAWSYAAASDGTATAPGQLSMDTLMRWRMPPADDAGLFVLLGGPQIVTSPGPAVYNAWFARNSIRGCYLPVLTRRPAQTLDWLTALGLRGASVTMPLKREVLNAVDAVDASAAELGAANTVSVRDGRRVAFNTDGEGACNALEHAGATLAGRSAVVLGAGGTAAAIAWSLKRRGARVVVLNRSAGRARDLGARLGVDAGGLEDLDTVELDVLVNATPVGAADSEATLVSERERLRGAVVLDAVLRADTRLVRDARAVGARVVTGYDMWRHQGRLQLATWLGRDVRAADLEVDP